MKLIYLLLLSVLLASYWAIWRIVVRRSSGLNPLLGWLVGLAFFVVAPLSIMTLNGGFTLPPAWGVDRAWASVDLSGSNFFWPYAVVWLSLMLCCLVVYVFLERGPSTAAPEAIISISAIKRALWITFAAAVCFWIFAIVLAGGVEQFLVSHWYTRNEDAVSSFGDAFVLVSHLAVANQVIFVASAALYTSASLKMRKWSSTLVSMIICELLGEMLFSGNRIGIAIYLLAMFASCWVYRRTRLIVAMFALAPALVLAFSLWASIRGGINELGDRTGKYFESDRGSNLVTSLMDVTEGADTMILFHIVKDFGKDIPYLYGESYLRSFTSLIPRRFYPNKPSNFTVALAEIYVPGETTSLAATALGEMYANFGPVSILLMPVLTLGIIRLGNWSVRTRDAHPLRSAVLFVLIISVARATVEDSFVLFILVTIMIWAARLEVNASRVGLDMPALRTP